jgi:hypothetical protein
MGQAAHDGTCAFVEVPDAVLLLSVHVAMQIEASCMVQSCQLLPSSKRIDVRKTKLYGMRLHWDQGPSKELPVSMIRDSAESSKEYNTLLRLPLAGGWSAAGGAHTVHSNFPQEA